MTSPASGAHQFFDESEDGRDAQLMLAMARNAPGAHPDAPRARRIWLASFGMRGEQRANFWAECSSEHGGTR